MSASEIPWDNFPFSLLYGFSFNLFFPSLYFPYKAKGASAQRKTYYFNFTFSWSKVFKQKKKKKGSLDLPSKYSAFIFSWYWISIRNICIICQNIWIKSWNVCVSAYALDAVYIFWFWAKIIVKRQRCQVHVQHLRTSYIVLLYKIDNSSRFGVKRALTNITCSTCQWNLRNEECLTCL